MKPDILTLFVHFNMRVLLLVRYTLPLLSFSIALLKGVSALFATLTFWAFYGSIRQYDNSGWISFIEENGYILNEGEYKWKFVILPHLIYISISFVITFFLFKAHSKIIGFKNNINALIVRKALQSGKGIEYALYLRPFHLERKIGEPEDKRSYSPLFWPTDFYKHYFHTFEVALAKALYDRFPIIGLGKGFYEGAGRIKTHDYNWKDEFRLLADNSKIIFIVPALSEGSIYEINYLIEKKYLTKSIFIMPSYVEKIDIREEWTKTIQVLNKMGLMLPDHKKNGCLIRVDAQGKPVMYYYLEQKSIRRLKKEINNILVDLSLHKGSRGLFALLRIRHGR